MGYCSLEDLKKAVPYGLLVELTDDEGLGAVDQARIDRAIAQADAEIDAYCGTRYTVLFAAAPDAVRNISADIALYNLYARRVSAMPEVRAEGLKRALRTLEGIARGLVSLGSETGTAAGADSSAETSTSTDERIFTRDSMEGF